MKDADLTKQVCNFNISGETFKSEFEMGFLNFTIFLKVCVCVVIFSDFLNDRKQMRMTDDHRGAFRAVERSFHLLRNKFHADESRRKAKGDLNLVNLQQFSIVSQTIKTSMESVLHSSYDPEPSTT